MTVIESALDNSGAAQDYVFTYDDKKGTIWAVCCDGHGSNKDGTFSLTTWIKDYDWTTYFERCAATPNRHPGLLLNDDLSLVEHDTLGEGVCIMIVRLTKVKVDFWWRGDVVGRVYTGNELLVSSSPHSCISLQGVKSAAELTVEWQVKVLNAYELTMVPSARMNLNPHYDKTGRLNHECADLLDNCAVYNCLGHRGWASGKWDTLGVPLARLTEVSIVVGSDGLWDMLSDDEVQELPSLDDFSASTLVSLAARRWRQYWTYFWHGKVAQTLQKIDSADDVSCLVLRIG